MKYTKLFNNHSEYVAYTGSTGFITPNVSWCIEDEEAHCTPKGDTCVEQHIYALMGEPSYPSSVPASATSFDLSFTYTDTYTATTCEEGSFINGDTVTIPIDENPSMSARTISGTYAFHDISIPYSFTQEGREELPYNQQYLTFEILTGGTILWKATTTAVTRTISYSVNYGEWTEITSTATGTPISVSAGDKVRLKGTNNQYATSKTAYSAFSGGTAEYNAEGNIMSLTYGDNFTGQTTLTTGWALSNVFNHSNIVSAENLVMPATTLSSDCYRATFANSPYLEKSPKVLPATTLVSECYYYMFDNCTSLTTAPELPATTLVSKCYNGMFHTTGTANGINYIKCLATNPTTANTADWVGLQGGGIGVASSGVFVKDANANWTTGKSGIPTGWVVKDADALAEPTIGFDGFNTITLSCETTGATIYYKLNHTGNYSVYTTAITITADTFIEAYSEENGETSSTVSQTCVYVSDDPFAYSNRSLDSWTYVNDSIDVTVPYSVNAIDGHSSHYKTDGDNPKLPFSFDTSFGLKEAQPTYLWFEHADQSADIYVDNTLVETHWGGYNAFFSDISNYVHAGTNNIRVSLRNKQRSELAPCAGDFNFNATLGYVKLFTSQYLPDKEYGYDGFHITSTVSTASATINISTSIPTGATVICKIDSGNTNIYSATSASTNAEMVFTTTIQNPHLWNGTNDPFMYTVTLEVYHDGDLYHRYVRPYGFRYYEYVINDTVKYGTAGNPYTGFLLNGSPYLLRGVCMHSDKDGKANALTSADIASDFNIIEELGCNFIRLAHYPHPKAVYDTCDRLGIVVQTEVPWVNQSSSGQPEAYYTHLTGQYDDMVKQHYNHPCIFFWGIANEITPSTTAFTKDKIEQYTAQIKALDNERMVGFVMSHSYSSPTSFGTPNVDWFGCNIYVGWYVDRTSNNPTSQLNTRVNNFITKANKPFAFSEYGCGGTQLCHSDDPQTTTTKGTNQPRHDIEYQMWLHEGHIAAIRNFPQLMFTSQWQLFDIAVYNRQEGYIICLDGENTSTDDDLKYLNNKGLVERDHVTKKDTFYLYKAWWNQTDKFVHICGKNYQKVDNRVIKCYTNDGSTLTMYINGVSAATATVTNNIATFTAMNFNNNDTIMVSGATSTDSFNIVDPNPKNVITYAASAKLDEKTEISQTSGILINAFSGANGQQLTIENHTFNNGVGTIEFDGNIVSVGNNAFEWCIGMTSIHLPNSVTSIGSNTFNNCRTLTGITIPDSVTTIGNLAFYVCSAMTNVIFSTGLTSIGYLAFYECDSLTNINIPDNVRTIGYNAFRYCIGLETVTIGTSVTSIDYGAFSQCNSLTSFTINATTPPTLGSNIFEDSNNCPIYVPSGSVELYKAASGWSTYASRIQAIP